MSPGFNVIAGDSDAGKSSFIHAIELLLLNRMYGKSPKWETYKSWFPGTKETLVVSEFEDVVVQRRRATGVNAYQIDDQKPLDPVNKDQPIQVLEATRMGKINLQNQHEKYFLLQETSGTVASYLNELVGLQIIDTMTDGVAKEERDTKDDLEKSKKLEKEYGDKLQVYEFLDQVEPLLIDAQALEQSLVVSTTKLERLTRLEKVYTEAEESLIEIMDWLEVKPQYEESQALGLEITNLTTKLTRLETLASNFDRLNSSLDDLNSWLGVRAGFNGLNALAAGLDTLNAECTKLARLETLYDTQTTRLQSVVGRLDRFKAEYEVMIRTAGVCPTCGSPITEDVCTRIWE